MLFSWTLTTSHSKTGATSNLHITGSSQKRPAASDNVQNHTQVTEVVELAPPAIRDRRYIPESGRGESMDNPVSVFRGSSWKLNRTMFFIFTT
jgi:hypothetical protein